MANRKVPEFVSRYGLAIFLIVVAAVLLAVFSGVGRG